jgi:hypothetical protein
VTHFSDITRRGALVLGFAAVLGLAPPGASAQDGGLTYFGFAGGCDREIFIQETAPFSNICVVDIQDERLRDSTWVSDSVTRNMRVIVAAQHTLFEPVGEPGDPHQVYDLRPDYQLRWQIAIQDKHHALGTLAEYVFVADEPHWNGISRDEMAEADRLIKTTLPWLATLTSFSDRIEPSWFDGQEVPVDAVGYHQYHVRDPRVDPIYQDNLDLIRSYSPGRAFFYVLDAWWSAEHSAAGLEPTDMAEVARNTLSMAEADERAVGIVGFHWPSLPYGRGARDLPPHVRWQYRTIGSGITGKCLAPRWVDAKGALFFFGCEYFATLWMRTECGYQYAAAMPGDRHSGIWILGDGELVGGLEIIRSHRLRLYPVFHTAHPARIRVHHTDTGELVGEFTANQPHVD